MKIIHLTPQDDIQKQLDGIPFNEPVHVMLEPGIYRQKLRLKQDHLFISGQSAETTILTWNDYAKKIHADGKEYNTFRTPTLTLYGNHVELRNLTIENSAGLGSVVGQAVALSVYGDDVTLSDCHLKAHQDTLFCGPLPFDLTVRYQNFLPDEDLRTFPNHHHFQRCLIEGDVDFIFGSATAWFEECEIRITGRGYLSAPSTYESSLYGLIFTDCKISNESDSSAVFLGRPWREFGSTLFVDCTFSGVFDPERFNDWDKAHYRFLEHPYVPSRLSSDLSGGEVERMKEYLGEQFTRSRKMI